MKITFTLKLYKDKDKKILCQDASICLLSNPSLLYPCKNLGDGVFEVELPEGFSGNNCLDFYAICNDCESTSCPPVTMRVCPCITDEDCGDCGECVNGVCVFRCDEELCNNGACEECNDNIPCTKCGTECINGFCNCPVGTFWSEEANCCVECDSSTPLPNCYVCQGFKIVRKDCICDDATGECVECINSDHCADNEDGRNCCSGNKCVCCPGFVWDPILQICVPEPDCKTDDDCLSCQVCSKGKCNTLPKWIIVDGACVYAPCGDVDCVTGLDCEAEDCGCDQASNKCVDCATNPNALGCNNKCNGEPCTSAADCQEGCGCYQGQCVDCSNFPCGNLCGSVPGCGCPDGVTCEGDTACNESDFTSEVKDCTLVSELKEIGICPCSGISTMFDVVSVNYKEETAGGGVVTSLKGDLDYRLELRKGDATNRAEFLTLPLLDNILRDEIAFNDLPKEGSFTLKITGQYVNFIDSTINKSTETIYTNTSSIVSKTALNYDLNDVEIYTRLNNSDYKYLESATYTLEYENLDFHNNCNYTSGTVFSITLDTNVLGNNNSVLTPSNKFAAANKELYLDILRSESSRFPLFKYQVDANKDGSFTSSSVDEYIRKAYIPLSGTTYTDILYGPSCYNPLDKFPLENPEGRIWSGYSYKITNDCAECKEAQIEIIENLIFCEETDITPFITLSNCNTDLEIDPFEIFCPINQNLDKWRSSDCVIPNDAQVEYIVYVDDIERGRLKAGMNDLTQSFSYSSRTSIESIKIVHNHDEECILFEEMYDAGIEDLQYEVECNDTSSRILIPKEQGVEDIVNLKYDGVIYSNTNGGNFVIPNLEAGKSYVIEITYTNGCKDNEVIPIDCCGDAIIEAEIIGSICNGQTAQINAVAKGFGGETVVMTLYFPTTGNIRSNNNILTEVENPGDYRIEAVFGEGDNICTVESILTVTDCTDVEINIIPAVRCTTGEASTLIITGNQFDEIEYTTPLGGTVSATLDEDGNYSISITASGDYTITSINGIFLPDPLVATLNTISSPVVSSLTVNPDPVCVNTTVTYTIVGTAGGTVVFNTGEGADQSAVIPSTGTLVGTTQYATAGTKTFIVRTVSVDDCTSDVDITTTTVVNVSPIFSNVIASCNSSYNQYSVSLNISPGTSVVTSDVGVVSGTGGTRLVSGIPSGTEVNITATDSGCSTVYTITQDCNCPEIPLNFSLLGQGVICDGETNFTAGNGVIVSTSTPGSYTYEVKLWIGGEGGAPLGEGSYTENSPGNITITGFDTSVVYGMGHQAKVTFTDAVTGCVSETIYILLEVDPEIGRAHV